VDQDRGCISDSATKPDKVLSGARAEARGQTRQDAGADRGSGKTTAPSIKVVKKVTLPDGSETEAPWLVGLRDRALICVMTYAFARIGAVVAMKVEDYYPERKRWWVRLNEKGGKRHEMPAHHKLEAFIDAYLDAAGIREDGKTPSSARPSARPAC
jgi:hypothetical protein